jgi:hypothetical protein
MISVITLLIVLTLSILLTRVAAVALSHTGISREAARFQARSAFTGVGFTTSESEKVVNHPVRRRILLLIMLLGNAGVVTAIASLIVTFTDVDRSGSTVTRAIVLACGLVALAALAYSDWVDRHLSRVIAWALGRYTKLDVKDYAGLLHLGGEYSVTELHVDKGKWLCDKTLEELGLPHEGILVLAITRDDGTFLGTPQGDTLLKPNDTLIVYGRGQALENIDRRAADAFGEWEKKEAEEDQKYVEKEEAEEDPEKRQKGNISD